MIVGYGQGQSGCRGHHILARIKAAESDVVYANPQPRNCLTHILGYIKSVFSALNIRGP